MIKWLILKKNKKGRGERGRTELGEEGASRGGCVSFRHGLLYCVSSLGVGPPRTIKIVLENLKIFYAVVPLPGFFFLSIYQYQYILYLALIEEGYDLWIYFHFFDQ